MEKDDDVIFDPIVDISKLFDTPIVSGNFSVCVFLKQLSPLYLSEDVSWKSPIFCSLLSHALQREGKLERKGKQHLTLILYNLFLRKQEKPFISDWVFNKGNYLYFKLVIVSFWQLLCLTMVFWYIITIRLKVDIDYLHADKEWFESLV